MSGYYASGKHAIGICDRCGFQYKLKTLKSLVIKDNDTNLLVCNECWEEDHPQNRQGELRIYDPQALRDARPDPALEASREITEPYVLPPPVAIPVAPDGYESFAPSGSDALITSDGDTFYVRQEP